MVKVAANHRARILVVDDETPFRRLMCRLFSEADVREAASGPEALAVLQQDQFDLIIMDLMLGSRPDGLELLPMLKETRDIPIRVMIG